MLKFFTPNDLFLFVFFVRVYLLTLQQHLFILFVVQLFLAKLLCPSNSICLFIITFMCVKKTYWLLVKPLELLFIAKAILNECNFTQDLLLIYWSLKFVLQRNCFSQHVCFKSPKFFVFILYAFWTCGNKEFYCFCRTWLQTSLFKSSVMSLGCPIREN